VYRASPQSGGRRRRSGAFTDHARQFAGGRAQARNFDARGQGVHSVRGTRGSSPAGRETVLYMRNVGGSPRVVVKFGDTSSAVQIDDHLLDPLGMAARAANRIYLHGHTDTYVASETGTELAISRAVEVRRLLISLNVEPERIRLFLSRRRKLRRQQQHAGRKGAQSSCRD
jgi:hypothetical protein